MFHAQRLAYDQPTSQLGLIEVQLQKIYQSSLSSNYLLNNTSMEGLNHHEQATYTRLKARNAAIIEHLYTLNEKLQAIDSQAAS
ncbi:hypothetical protein [Actinotignum sp. GS-2025d]|uniref:hypothetical protein n=1 Tax=Actinotignum sp. GS-2025d TaxID=3427277 RepID=UPI003F466B22